MNWKECVLSELLHADDLVLINETIERLMNKFMKWKSSENKSLKVILGKTKVVVNKGITKDGFSQSNACTCGMCWLKAKALSFSIQNVASGPTLYILKKRG